MSKRKNTALYILLLAFSIVFLVIGNRIASKNAHMFLGQTSTNAVTDRYIVRVDAVLDKQLREVKIGENILMTETKIKFSSTVLFGERKGETIIATQIYDDLSSRSMTSVKQGSWIFVYLTPATSSDYYSGEFFRLHYLIGIALVFFILLLLFGKFQGLSTIIALSLSILSIFLVFIPAILSGFNIYLWAIVICLFTIIINPYFIGGFNKKSTASALGCVGGVTIAGFITIFLNQMLQITGAVDEETMMVTFILEDKPIDLRAIAFAAILIGALGATVDVSMSIATSINEMNATAEKSNFKSLVNYGMNIGRDILGAQTSTLVLAYIGGALSVTLLLVTYQNSVLEMLNLELVVIEMLQMLIGGFVILFTIPATAIVSALMFDKKGDGSQKSLRRGKGNKPHRYKIGH